MATKGNAKAGAGAGAAGAGASAQELTELANGLDTLSQRLKNALSAANIEWPEDSQEGNSDRKFHRHASEQAAITNAVWENVNRVNAKILDVIEVTKQQSNANKDRFLDSLELYDAVKMRSDENFNMTLKHLATVHKEVVASGNDVASQVATGNQVASTREVAQDSSLNDLIKSSNDAVNSLLAKVESLERAQNNSNKA